LQNALVIAESSGLKIPATFDQGQGWKPFARSGNCKLTYMIHAVGLANGVPAKRFLPACIKSFDYLYPKGRLRDDDAMFVSVSGATLGGLFTPKMMMKCEACLLCKNSLLAQT